MVLRVQADKVDMYWNSKGSYVLLLTSTETDKTGASYYGKQSLHFLTTKGDTAIVLLSEYLNIIHVHVSVAFCLELIHLEPLKKITIMLELCEVTGRI